MVVGGVRQEQGSKVRQILLRAVEQPSSGTVYKQRDDMNKYINHWQGNVALLRFNVGVYFYSNL